VGADTVLRVDQDGAGDFAAPDTTVTLAGVDLLGGAIDQAAALDALVANGNLQAQAAAA
jgi:hypothetical protein